MRPNDRTGGFSDDAKAAVVATPGYFMTWYTIKSIGLCVALAALAFLAGRASRR